MTKLTPFQVKVLECCLATGWDCPPGGYSTAGRDASRWWRTVQILVTQGLVTYKPGENCIRITEAGREAHARATLTRGAARG